LNAQLALARRLRLVYQLHVLADEIRDQYGAEVIGRADSIVVRYYAISIERRITHPAVLAVSEAAKKSVFVDGSAASNRPSTSRM